MSTETPQALPPLSRVDLALHAIMQAWPHGAVYYHPSQLTDAMRWALALHLPSLKEEPK